MAGIHGRRRAVAIAKAEKAETGVRFFWIATLSAGLAAAYAISLFLS
jgi:hypothetical protein